MVDIYDLRGRLLKTAELESAGRIDVRALVGFSTENVLLVKNRGSQTIFRRMVNVARE
jgi:hypothetical protein